MDHYDLNKYLINGARIFSSGTTGAPKSVFRTAENIRICNDVAVRAQRMTKNSSIYTVTKLSHAGGLLAQTLPAFSVGARVKIEKFNPFRFLTEFENHSHTFLPPQYMEVLLKVKKFKNYDFKNKWILTGSNPVSYDIMKAFVERNAIVQPNWGMSEVGPLTIYSIIDSMEKLETYKKQTPQGTTLMGDCCEVDYKLEKGELVIKGSICVHKSWFFTGDCVEVIDGHFYYKGRKNWTEN